MIWCCMISLKSPYFNTRASLIILQRNNNCSPSTMRHNTGKVQSCNSRNQLGPYFSEKKQRSEVIPLQQDSWLPCLAKIRSGSRGFLAQPLGGHAAQWAGSTTSSAGHRAWSDSWTKVPRQRGGGPAVTELWTYPEWLAKDSTGKKISETQTSILVLLLGIWTLFFGTLQLRGSICSDFKKRQSSYSFFPNSKPCYGVFSPE